MIETPWIYHEQLQPTGETLPIAYRRLAARVLILSLVSAFGPLTYREMHVVRRQVITAHVFRTTNEWWCSPDVAMAIWEGSDRAIGIAFHWADRAGFIAHADGINSPDFVDISDVGEQWLQMMTQQKPNNAFLMAPPTPRAPAYHQVRETDFIELELDS